MQPSINATSSNDKETKSAPNSPNWDKITRNFARMSNRKRYYTARPRTKIDNWRSISTNWEMSFPKWPKNSNLRRSNRINWGQSGRKCSVRTNKWETSSSKSSHNSSITKINYKTWRCNALTPTKMFPLWKNSKESTKISENNELNYKKPTTKWQLLCRDNKEWGNN